ncbi:MAG: hypothetical protein ACXW2C_04750 [Acidimicrobiia bacterium]
MRFTGTTTHSSWRRAAALLAFAPALAIVGLAGTASAAEAPADDSTTTTVAPVDPTATATTPTPGRLSTGDKVTGAEDDPAGLDPDTAQAAEEAGSEELSGKPGECGEKSCKHLTPIVECSFKDPGTGLYNTVWSYRSGGSRDTIPVGWYNYFTPGKIDRGQPTVFEPGLHKNVLITTHSGSLTWVLGLRKATAPGRDCDHNPVPITGAGLSSIVTLFAVGGLLGVVLVIRSRRRRAVKA